MHLNIQQVPVNTLDIQYNQMSILFIKKLNKTVNLFQGKKTTWSEY